MRYLTISVFLFTYTFSICQTAYNYTLDLVNVKDDKVKVELMPPSLSGDKAVFNFPKVIPGTYSTKNYGRFIEEFIAADKEGNRLKVKNKKTNSFIIEEAQKLAKITYWVNDTWDDKGGNFVFQPGGSNIEAGDNYVLNNNSFFGYFEGNKNDKFTIDISRPERLLASTYLSFTTNNNTDHFEVEGYNLLVDNPILYCEPDILTYKEGQTDIVISVYSQTGKFKAEKIKEYIQPITSALAKFWGGELPIDKYCFLIYLVDPKTESSHKSKGLGGYGALEHNRCSFYYLPEIDYEKRFKQMIFDVSAHEFLHIITPLNLHSNEIGDFDFIHPKMSQHLWLYEGVTEYFSLLVQVENGLMDEASFMKEIRSKINQSEDYKNLSFTKMSENILSNKYQKQYSNVYCKGALLAFLLDIKLMQYSDKRLIDVVRSLVDKYGADKSFSDDVLINEIVSLTAPEVATFFNNYIIGYQALPYQSYFNQIGWQYAPLKTDAVAYFGRFGVIYEDSLLKIDKPSLDCLFSFKQGDVLKQVNDIEITEDNIDEVFDDYFSLNKSFAPLNVVVIRGGEQITLTATPRKGTLSQKNHIMKNARLSISQLEKNRLFFDVLD